MLLEANPYIAGPVNRPSTSATTTGNDRAVSPNQELGYPLTRRTTGPPPRAKRNKRRSKTHERPTATRSIATTTRFTGLKMRRRKPLPDVPPTGTGTVPLSSHIVRPKKHGRSSARMTPSNYPPSPSPSHSSTSLEGNETSRSRPTIGQPVRIERLQLPGQAEGAVDLSYVPEGP
ncbi:hypothetical protein PM082_022663 [Marasmius tenuissimus]|nr:hypothetical protein PM082_022663 [Marasmius tenuissimus]